MIETKDNLPLKFGLLCVALVWFFFSGYQFIKGAFNIYHSSFWIALTDTAGMFGLGFRTMAALIAVFTILFFIAKKDLSKPELLMSVRWVILGEIVYFLALFPVLIWFMALNTGASSLGLGTILESALPVFVESVIIPVALVKLFFELNPNKPEKGAIKWGLIAGTIYIFMFWLNNTGNWASTVTEKGIEYVTAYPDHILSFGLTTVGLLALALYAAYFTKKSIGTQSLEKLNLRKVGAIVTAVGLYFLVIYVMWLLFGTDAKWSYWYAWFLGHNMDLWALVLPLAGVPLLFHNKK
ncbi:MAG: hypothetical protein NWF06_00180 [Candidatus Bathyarchaeota archaeon]|nr:hypothetical protein [Candidatus Bathyarchaeum sp.]